MQRNGWATTAVLLALPVLTAGCGTEPAPPPQAPAPLVLAELRAACPGPWRHGGREPIVVTALERTDVYRPPAEEGFQPSWPGPPRGDAAAADSAMPAVDQEARQTVREPRKLAAYRQAELHVRRGFRLLEQGAYYLARAEFTAALKRVAVGNDRQHGTRQHVEALQSGLLALAECGDFTSARAAGSRASVAQIAGGHRTPVLRQVALDRLTPVEAAKRYGQFARQQLSIAAGRDVDASMALYGLGVVAQALVSGRPSQPSWESRALYQAALLVDASNRHAAGALRAVAPRDDGSVAASDRPGSTAPR